MMKPKMTEVVAERKIEAVRPGSKAAVITVQVGTPAPDPNPKGDWYCPIRIKGFGRNMTRAYYGVDRLQALQFAFGILELELRAFAGNAKLSWLDQADLGLKPWAQKVKKAPTSGRTVRAAARP